MICPKCGYDCGNAKFCPECGEKLLGKTVNDSNAQVWSVGMPCPHCGGTKLDGNCCAFCGAQLLKDSREPIKCCIENLPLGIYRGPYGYLKLRTNDLVIKNKHTRECVIPYDQIEEIKYTEPSLWCYGRITIRWDGNSYLPLPKTYGEELRDESTFLHKVGDEDLFFQIYHTIRDYITQ